MVATTNNERVLFNRRYKPFSDKNRWVCPILVTEHYYNDGTEWIERFFNSLNGDALGKFVTESDQTSDQNKKFVTENS